MLLNSSFSHDMSMLRNFFFGNTETKRNENEVPEIEDDQPYNRFNEIQILSGHTDLVDALINIGNSRVLSTGQDKKGIVWDCKSGEIIYELIGHTCAISAVLYIEDYVDSDTLNVAPVIVTASSDQTVRIWDFSNGECCKIIKEQEGTVKCFCRIPSDPMMILSGGQELCLWNLSFQMLSKLQRNSLDYVHTVISIKSDRIVVATDQPHLVVYSLLKNTNAVKLNESYEIREYKKLPRHKESITSISAVSDAMFVSASMDGAIILWTSHRLEAARKFNCYENYVNLTDHTYPYAVHHILVVDQRYIFAAIGSGFAIYDALCAISEGCVCRVANAHYSSLTCMALLSNGSYVATSSLDGTVRLWAAPFSQTHGDTKSRSGKFSYVAKLFGKKSLDYRTFPLKLELVGLCRCHSNSVQSIIECGKEGFISCGNDGLVILWKDSDVLQVNQDDELRQVLHTIGWLDH